MGTRAERRVFPQRFLLGYFRFDLVCGWIWGFVYWASENKSSLARKQNLVVLHDRTAPFTSPGSRLEGPETFSHPESRSKTDLKPYDHRVFIHIYLRWTEALFTQEVSGLYTSLFLDTDELKMALRARNVSGSFEKRAGGVIKVRLLSRVFLQGVV